MKTSLKSLILAVAVLFSSHGFSQESNVQKISDNVYSMFFDFYHSLVVIGDKGVLITDPANVARAQKIKNAVAKLTTLPVSHIVLSHEHYDHVGGTEIFNDARVIAHKHAEAVFVIDITGQAPKKVDQYIDNEASIMMGKTKVNLMHVGAADGVGMLSIHLPKEKVVYSADLYETNEITNKMWLADSNFLGSRVLLNTLVALKPDYSITTHSASLDPKHLILAADFYNDLYDAVAPKTLEAMTVGFSAIVDIINNLPQEIKLEKYKDFKNYDHLPYHAERMILSIFHGG